MIEILTIEREYGTGASLYRGKDSWKSSAGKLWDSEITEEIARRLKCKASMVRQREERLDSIFYGTWSKPFLARQFRVADGCKSSNCSTPEHLANLFEKK